MSTITAPASHHGASSPDFRTPLLLDVLRSEWTKLRSSSPDSSSHAEMPSILRRPPSG